MGELKVGDWTVIEEQIMEVTGFTPDGTVIVRPLSPATEVAPTLQVGWAGEGIPMPTVTTVAGPALVVPPGGAALVEQIREAMRLAKENPYREVIFGGPWFPPED